MGRRPRRSGRRLVGAFALLLVAVLLVAPPHPGRTARAAAPVSWLAAAPLVHPGYAPPPPNELPAHYSWLNLSRSQTPEGRFGAATAFDAADGYALLFGGEVPENGQVLGDTWAFVHGSWRELCSGSSQAPSCRVEPAPSVNGSMTFDATTRSIIYYDWAAARTWSFAGGAWAEVGGAVHPPAQPFPSEIAFDAADGVVILVGASGATWTFSDGNWSVADIVGPAVTPRVGALLFFDIALDRLVLYGGVEGYVALGDTWEYFNGSWSPVASRLVPPGGFAAQYDASFGYGALLVASAGGDYALWGFAQGNWSPMSRNGSLDPAAALGSAFVFDPVDGYLLLFSGEVATAAGPAAPPTTFALVDNFRVDRLALSRTEAVQGDTVMLEPLGLGGVLPYTYVYVRVPPGCSNVNEPANPCRTFTVGSYLIVATILDGPWGAASVNATLTVVPIPAPSFTVAPDPVTAGEPVTVSASVQGGIPPFEFRWDFGDGAGGNGVRAEHAYAAAGRYTVNLTIANGTNVTESVAETEFVNPFPAFGLLIASPNVTDAGLPVSFTATLNGGTPPFLFLWAFGSGQGGGNGPAISHPYTEAGRYRAMVWANDSTGASIVGSTTVTVHPDPLVDLITGRAQYNTTVEFGAALSGGTPPFVAIWNLGDGTVVAGTHATHAYAHRGTYVVTLTVRDSVGWSTTKRIALVVEPNAPPAPPTPWYEQTLNLVILGGIGGALAAFLILAARWSERREEAWARGEVGEEGPAPPDEEELLEDEYGSEYPAPSEADSADETAQEY